MPALGAEGRHLQGRKLVWGGKEHGALRLGTPRHANLHFDPQATTFLSPPGGIYLISMKPHFLDVTKPPVFIVRGRPIQNPGSSRESPMPRRGVCGLESANWATKKPKPTRVRSELTSEISRKPRLPRDSSLAMILHTSYPAHPLKRARPGSPTGRLRQP